MDSGSVNGCNPDDILDMAVGSAAAAGGGPLTTIPNPPLTECPESVRLGPSVEAERAVTALGSGESSAAFRPWGCSAFSRAELPVAGVTPAAEFVAFEVPSLEPERVCAADGEAERGESSTERPLGETLGGW